MLVVCIAGLMGNVAAILVFGKSKKTQKNFYTFMFYLAVFDLIYVIMALWLFVLPQFTITSPFMKDGMWYYIVPFAIPIGQISMTGSVYFTAAITIERYLTVCKPFYMVSRNLSARPMSFGIMLFAFLYNFPKFFEMSTLHNICYYNQTYTTEIRRVTFNSENCEHQFYAKKKWRTFPFELLSDDESNGHYGQSNSSMSLHIYGIEGSALRFNSAYVQAYTIYSNLLINGIVPFFLVIILNVWIVVELQKTDFPLSPKSSRKREESRHSIFAPNSPTISSRKRKELGVAKISLTIAMIFILCHFVKWIPNIHEMIMHIQGRIPVPTKEIEIVANVVISMNVTSNEIIASNSSYVKVTSPITTSTVYSIGEEGSPGQDYWPNWIRRVMCISHLCLAFNSSVNFYIYFIKRKALNSGSRLQELMMTTITTSNEAKELITHK